MIRRGSSLKKVLASMIVLGSMSFLTVTGTFALMSADVKNGGSIVTNVSGRDGAAIICGRRGSSKRIVPEPRGTST